MSADRRYWLAVASADHVRHGKQQGFMQVGHGKGGPLKRPHAGDGVVYYSPTAAFGGKERLQAFTSIGVLADERSTRPTCLRKIRATAFGRSAAT